MMGFTVFLASMALALVVFALTAIYSAEILAAVLSRKTLFRNGAERPNAAILIPAHNEEKGLQAMLDGLRPSLCAGDRMVVIADNCTDATEAIARAAGAEVVVRNDDSRRGKGYALDAGVTYLKPNAPAVVVIVDADCRLEKGALDALVRSAAATGKPSQARYLMKAPVKRISLQVAEFAFLLKNHVRARGLNRLGAPCQLAGSGMAFPWAILCDADLAHGDLVEDLRLGLELAEAGKAPVFREDAIVLSAFPTSNAGAHSQRQRWVQGHMTMMVKALKMIPAALKRFDFASIAMALDVLIPPLSLLVGLQLLSLSVALISGGLLSTGWTPAILASFSLLLFFATTFAAWALYGRQALPTRSLIGVVPFVAARLLRYPLMLVASRQTEWKRADRS